MSGCEISVMLLILIGVAFGCYALGYRDGKDDAKGACR